jgi:hypothetical protein
MPKSKIKYFEIGKIEHKPTLLKLEKNVPKIETKCIFKKEKLHNIGNNVVEKEVG